MIERWLERSRALDRAVARAETALCVAVLLGMVVVASVHALCFNLGENGVAAARAAVEWLSWADPFLQKGTLFLAFVGASLATHEARHVSIDVVPRLVSGRVARYLRVVARLGAGVIALLLAVAFFDACLVADAAVPFEYEHLTAEGRLHVCDAGAADAPALLCALRSGLSHLGIAVTSGSGIAQLIAPLSLVLMGVRLLGGALGAALSHHELEPAARSRTGARAEPGDGSP